MFTRVKPIWHIHVTFTRIRMASHGVRLPTSDQFLLRFIRSLPSLLLFCPYTTDALLSHALHVILSPGRRRLNRKKMGYTIQSSIVIDIFVWLWASVVCDIVRKATPSASGECLQHACPRVGDRVCTSRRVLLCVHVHEYMRVSCPASYIKTSSRARDFKVHTGAVVCVLNLWLEIIIYRVIPECQSPRTYDMLARILRNAYGRCRYSPGDHVRRNLCLCGRKSRV